LASLYRAVIDMPEAWEELGTKYRMPEDYLIALGRAVGVPSAYQKFIYGVPAEMGQQTYAATGPNGWEDTTADWLTGYGMLRRADVAAVMAAGANGVDGLELMKDLYGDNLSSRTESTLLTSTHPKLGLGLALASPELMYY